MSIVRGKRLTALSGRQGHCVCKNKCTRKNDISWPLGHLDIKDKAQCIPQTFVTAPRELDTMPWRGKDDMAFSMKEVGAL